jgi:hypothetical protein
MQWTASEGDSWSTDFGDDSKSPFGPGLAKHSGKARSANGHKVRSCSTTSASFDASAGGCVFKYSASYTKGGKTNTVDPQVIIKPGT